MSAMLCFEGQLLYCFDTKDVKNIILADNQSCVPHRRQEVCHRPIHNVTVLRTVAFLFLFNMMEVEKALFFLAKNGPLSFQCGNIYHIFTKGTVPLETLGPCALLLHT